LLDSPLVVWRFYGEEISFIMIILSEFGIISHIVVNASIIPIFSCLGMLYGMFSVEIYIFIVWAHHVCTVGLNIQAHFAATTLICVGPARDKAFSCLATL